MCSDLTIGKAHTNSIITKLTGIITYAQLITYSACAIKPRLTQTFYPTKSFFHPLALLLEIVYFPPIFLLFSLEIPVIRPAEYKLPIVREIFICMFNLYIKIEF